MHGPSHKLWMGLVCAATLAVASSCATHRPCSEAGDTSWPTKFKDTDKQCRQKKIDGTFMNHGKFTERTAHGKIVLEGQFLEGKKDGVWSEFNEKGEKIAEKYFESGVEKARPLKP